MDDYKKGWNREHAQRSCILSFLLENLSEEERPKDNDIVMLSDVDEVKTRRQK